MAVFINMMLSDHYSHHHHHHDDLLTGGNPVAGGVGGDQRGEVDQRQEGRLQQLHHDQGAWGQLQDEDTIEDLEMNSDL